MLSPQIGTCQYLCPIAVKNTHLRPIKLDGVFSHSLQECSEAINNERRGVGGIWKRSAMWRLVRKQVWEGHVRFVSRLVTWIMLFYLFIRPDPLEPTNPAGGRTGGYPRSFVMRGHAYVYPYTRFRAYVRARVPIQSCSLSIYSICAVWVVYAICVVPHLPL